MNELKTSSKYINGEKVTSEYGYDLYGNKTETSSNGEFKRYHYNQNNEVSNIYTKEGNTDIYYDKNGNIRDIQYAGGDKEHFEFDEYGQLSRVSNTKSEWYNFRYDPQGDRNFVEKYVEQNFDKESWYEDLSNASLDDVEALLDDKNDEQTFDALRYQADFYNENKTCAIMPDTDHDFNKYHIKQVIDKTQKYSEVLASNDGSFHIYGEDERLYSEEQGENGGIDEITYVSGNNKSVFMRFEINSVSLTITPNSYKKIEYDDFGYTDDISKGFGYNGEALVETGLIYLRARYYNPKIGQFIQADGYAGEQKDIESQNRYAFAKQNPYKYIDRDGKMAIQVSDRPGKGKENSLNYWKEREEEERIKKNAQASVNAVLAAQKKTAESSKSSSGSSSNKKGTTQPSKASAEKGNKEIEKPKPKPRCTGFDLLGKRLAEFGQSIGDFTNDVWNGITDSATNFWNGLTSGVDKLMNDPMGFFGDALGAVWNTVRSPKFWAQAAVSGALMLATGGQSLWVQAIVVGSGGLGTGEAIDFGSTGFSVDKFFSMKGVDNFGEYLGQLVWRDAIASGTVYGSVKLNDYLKGLKEGASGTKVTANDIKFTDKFSKPGYQNQVTERLWNNQKIADAINNPYKVGDSVNKFTGNPVKVYYINEMHYVAIDDVTKKVVQVSDLNRKDWVFDLSK